VAAHRLQRLGHDVTLVELGAEVGGRTRTRELGLADQLAWFHRVGDLPYAVSTMVVLAWKHGAWADFPATDVVPVGPGEHPATRVMFVSRKSPSLVPPGAEALRVYLGDRASREVGAAEAVRLAKAFVGRLLSAAREEPLFEHVVRWERAYPVPRPGLYAKTRGLSAPTLEGALRSGERAAEEIHQALA
jgi:protoporphyrinogen oxidase